MDINWKEFEKKLKLDSDEEYQKLAIRAAWIASKSTTIINCTKFCNEFFNKPQNHYSRFQPGRILIGPDPNCVTSYTHEAVAILNKKSKNFTSVFDPIRNASFGQKDASEESANDRYSLKSWLNYKTRIHHHIFDITSPTAYSRPFCIFVLNCDYVTNPKAIQRLGLERPEMKEQWLSTGAPMYPYRVVVGAS